MADLLIDRPDLRVTRMAADAQLLLHCEPDSAAALASLAGVTLGDQMLRSAASGAWNALHLAPDEWLLVGPRQDVADMAASLVSPEPLSLVDISDRGLGVEISGAVATLLLNSGCPLDLDPGSFPPGACTRTLFGKAPVMLWRLLEGDRYRMQYGRSFDDYVTTFVATAAQDVPSHPTAL